MILWLLMLTFLTKLSLRKHITVDILRFLAYNTLRCNNKIYASLHGFAVLSYRFNANAIKNKDWQKLIYSSDSTYLHNELNIQKILIEVKEKNRKQSALSFLSFCRFGSGLQCSDWIWLSPSLGCQHQISSSSVSIIACDLLIIQVVKSMFMICVDSLVAFLSVVVWIDASNETLKLHLYV